MMRWSRLVGMSLAVLVIVAGTTSCSGGVQNLHVHGRTLLIYPDSGSTADAAQTGVLQTNVAGCIAVGKSVIVAPSGSVLMADGSIVVHGTTYKLGSRVVIGGGGGKALGTSGCGAHLNYFYI
ncbi:MAG TPA: hypothetical protein VHZ98_04860 [Galbitalea sp.]|nr:hypothetical protein [Galbitalea sp.]